MNRAMVWVLVLAVGMLAIESIAASRFYDDGSRSVVLSSKPIPCHIYLKAKHSAERQPIYVPDSFFQAKIQFLRMESDLFGMELEKKFMQDAKEFLQSELASVDAQKHPEHAERLAKKMQQVEDSPKANDLIKAPVVRVVEMLEGSSPGKEIVLSGWSRMRQRRIAPDKMYYVFGYLDRDQMVHTASFLRTPQEMREEKTVMGRFKTWVRWFLSECDNV